MSEPLDRMSLGSTASEAPPPARPAASHIFANRIGGNPHDPNAPRLPQNFIGSIIVAVVVGNLITLAVVYTVSRVWWQTQVVTPLEQRWNR